MSYAQDTQAPTPVEEGQTVPFSGVLIPTLQAAEMTARLEQQGNVCQARINSAVDLAVNEVDLRLRNCLSVSTTIDDMYKTQLLSQTESLLGSVLLSAPAMQCTKSLSNSKTSSRLHTYYVRYFVMSRNFSDFRKKVNSILFEDTYVTHGTMDNLRAGQDDGVELSDPILDLPIEPGPQSAAQLSNQVPPVDDPEYTPVNNKELSSALAALATELPDEQKIVQKTYEKFRKFVDNNKQAGIEVIDNPEDDVEENQLEELKNAIRNQLAISLLEQGMMPDTDAYGNKYDDLDDLDGPTDEELGSMEQRVAPEKAEPTKDESTLHDLAQEMGLSTSGIKRLEGEALKKLRLLMVHFPGDIDSIKEMAMQYFAKGLHNLDLIDAEEATDLMTAKSAYDLKSFRVFMWESFLNNVYKKMLRDADQAGIEEKDLGSLTPGLLDRATKYFAGLPDAKKMKVLVSSLSAAE